MLNHQEKFKKTYLSIGVQDSSFESSMSETMYCKELGLYSIMKCE